MRTWECPMFEYRLTAKVWHAYATGFVRASCRFNQLASEDTTLIEDTVLEPPHFPSEKWPDGLVYQPINLFRKYWNCGRLRSLVNMSPSCSLVSIFWHVEYCKDYGLGAELLTKTNGSESSWCLEQGVMWPIPSWHGWEYLHCPLVHGHGSWQRRGDPAYLQCHWPHLMK